MAITGETLITLAFTAAFTAWSFLLAWGIRVFRAQFEDIKGALLGLRGDLQKESEKLNEYIIQTEARLSVVEDRLKINHTQ